MTCAACRNIPAFAAKGYELQGSYEVIAGVKTFVTGSKTATSGIIEVFDVFGFSTPTLQGADMLASGTDSVVVVPDFFGGKSISHDWIPADTDEKKEKLSSFLSGPAAVPKCVDSLRSMVEVYEREFPSVKRWAAFGLCWGGKVAVLTSGKGTPFVVSGQTHPGQLQREDGEKLAIPHIVLASKDEPSEEVAAYGDIFKKNGIGGVADTYSSMWHGWMGARANLEQDESRNEYLRGYQQVSEFLKHYLDETNGTL